jgi:hypothetical protein
MSAHPLLLDTSSSLVDALKSLSNALFQVPVIITALVLAFVFAFIAWFIAYAFLRPKEVCSMVCSIHFLLTIATIVFGLLGAVGLIDHYYPGALITGAGVALLILAIPLFILAESFNYVVLSNKHARRHRDLRTPQDRNIRRGVIFLTPLLIGAILLVVGIIIGTVGAVTAIAQVIILLLVLWLLALGTELLILLLANRRRRKLAALGTGPMLDQQAVAELWVSGFSSYRIGRGRTEAIYWEEFTERVYITEELFLEEDGELDLIEVEEQEKETSYAVAGAAAGAAAGTTVSASSTILALHEGHRNLRHAPQNRFFRRWGSVVLLLIVAVLAVAFTIAAGTVAAATTAGIALAFLAPVIFLVLHRIRRDSEVRFATETAQKVSTVQYSASTAQAAGGVVAPTLPSGRTTGVQPAVPLHPARPVPVYPPMPEPQIPPSEEPEAPTLPSAETAEGAGAAHENPDIADDTIIAGAAGAIIAGTAGAAILADRGDSAGATHENPDMAEDTLLIGHTSVAEDTTTVSGSASVSAVSDSISVTEFQHYLRGIHYPATRAQLIEQARKNNAPPNMLARLEVLEEDYTFISVSEVMRGYAYHRYLRGVTYPATRDQLLAHARANNAPPRMITWLESLEVTVIFASLVEVMRSHTTHLQEKGEESAAEATLLDAAPAAPAPAAAADAGAAVDAGAAADEAPTVSSRIGIIEFQRYLHGVDYPATRAQLIAQARANNAPPNMLARLEELDETHSFVSVRDVMIGYAYHRYLRGATYPATRDELLAHARANNAPRKLIIWLESLDETVTFATLTEVVRSYSTHHVEEDVDEEDEAEERTKGIGFREFSHYLRGIHYPATRDQLLAQARANNAPDAMIARLEGLPEHHQYKGMADVMRGYGHHIPDEEAGE